MMKIQKQAKKKNMNVSILNDGQLLQALLENIPDHVYFKDRQSRFIRTSRAHRRILGLEDQKEIFGKTDFDLFPRKYAQKFYDEEQKIMESGKPVVAQEWKIPNRAGGTVWVSRTKIPITDRDGKMIGLVGISRNINVRKQAEKALLMAKKEIGRKAKALEQSNMALERSNRELEQSIMELEQSNRELEQTHEMLTVSNAALSMKTVQLEQANRILKNSEEEYRTLFEKDINPIFVLDGTGTCIDCNEAVSHFFPDEKEALIGRNIREIIQPYRVRRADGRTHVWKLKSPVELQRDDRGKKRVMELTFISGTLLTQQCIFVIGRDITERKMADDRIQASLREKELLLKEIHHRVKNNLQVIKSLLRLQSSRISDKHVLDLFQEYQNRIQSMALIHERLYRSNNFSQINLADYVRDLTGDLYRSLHVPTRTVELDLRLEDVQVGIDQAVPCGLILNELVSNSLKHAFPHDLNRDGKISISIQKRKDCILISICDNGIGIPENVDLKKTKSLGLHLVALLTEDQLNGKLQLDRKDGTRFQIQFKAM